jgi:hypothetical protein
MTGIMFLAGESLLLFETMTTSSLDSISSRQSDHSLNLTSPDIQMVKIQEQLYLLG